MLIGVDYVRDLCKQKKIPISRLEKDLGFSNGYFNPKKLKKIPYDRAALIADYLGGDIDLIMGRPIETKYYMNEETAGLAQKIFENKDLRVLFDAAQDATPEDLKTTYDLLMALNKKERVNRKEPDSD